MLTYVCSAQASAITGAALRVDGGDLRAGYAHRLLASVGIAD